MKVLISIKSVMPKNRMEMVEGGLYKEHDTGDIAVIRTVWACIFFWLQIRNRACKLLCGA